MPENRCQFTSSGGFVVSARLRITFALITVVIGLGGCVSTGEPDYVSITPISYVPVVGKGGASCQGWCETTKDQASRFRIKLGRGTFQRVVQEGALLGKNDEMAMLDFVLAQVKTLEVCASGQIKQPNSRHIIHTTENQISFWTDIECESFEGQHRVNR